MGNELENLVGEKKILLVVRWPVGGIRTFLKYVVESLPRERYEFHVIGVSTDGLSSLEKDIGNMVSKWTVVQNSGAVERELMFSVGRVLQTEMVDLVHAHGFTSAAVSALPSRIFGVPLICTSHDVINASQFEGVKGFVRRALLGLALRQCRLVHSVSRDAEENLLRNFPQVRPKSVSIINGINVAHFVSAEPAPLKKQLKLPHETVLIGFFGRFMNQKGFRFLVDAISVLRERWCTLHVHVVCFGSGSFIREERADIHRRGLDGAFSFIPFTPDVSHAMKGCDLVVIPSLWEACPLVPMEALAAGVPVVGSDCIGLREVLDGTPAVQSRAGDGLSLAEAIVKCISKGRKPFEEYSSLAANRFDVRRTANRIDEMYASILL